MLIETLDQRRRGGNKRRRGGNTRRGGHKEKGGGGHKRRAANTRRGGNTRRREGTRGGNKAVRTIAHRALGHLKLTRHRKVAVSSLGRNGGRMFFSRVNFPC